MVNGHKDRSSTPVMAIDLDGTYIKGNTLKIYIKTGIMYLAGRLQLMHVAKALTYLVARKLRLISHLTMKLHVAETIGWNDEMAGIFRAAVMKRINMTVASLAAQFEADGGKCVIASAAFGFYIPSITTMPFVATGTTIYDISEECRGEEKCRSINNWLKKNHGYLHSVITDHSDDIPLLKMGCRKRYLVNPSATSISAIKKAGIEDVIILH